MPSYSERITMLREKENLSKTRSSFSFRSFFYGFLLASFISYFVVCQFIAKSESHATLSTDSISSRTTLLRRPIPPSTLSPSKPLKRDRFQIEKSTHVASGATDTNISKSIQQVKLSSLIPVKNGLSTDQTVENNSKNKFRGKWSHFGTNSSEEILTMTDQFKSTNLVLGIAVNTNSKNFAIFCGSFRANSAEGEAIVFMNSPVSDRLRLIAESTRVNIIEFDVATLEPVYMRKYHPSSIRWILFDRLLRANEGALRKAFERVLLVDVRDTMFQDDPFKLIPETSRVFYVFGETPGVTIDSCGWNSGWVKDCFGENMLNMVRSSPILCSGVSMGSMDMVADYLSKMSGVLLGQSDLGKFFPKCERNGVDQGVHNVLVHTGLLSVVTVQYEHLFPVVNLQAYPQLLASAIYPAVLLSERGTKYSLVHQYDRLSSLQLALSQKYVDWVDMTDPRAEWDNEPTCAGYSVAYGMDYFRGRCELGSERLMSAASCCQSCLNKNVQHATARKEASSLASKDMFYGTKSDAASTASDYPVETLCTSFTYLNGVCYMKKCRQNDVRSALEDPNKSFYREDSAVSAYVRLT